MENLIISGTKKTPAVFFSQDGKLHVQGRSIPEDPTVFYDRLYLWIYEYCQHPAPQTEFDVHIEYFNSASSKSLLVLLRELTGINYNGYKVQINWHYEKEDDDILERGEYYQNILDFKFNFIKEDQPPKV
ncbi:MAG TPA: DUF1987 domain-containing protein [Bacteroidales bacterium]|nr:DUF1987 domain-containing protein [Bacteroidales bacterium]